jgi:hypothetical protein
MHLDMLFNFSRRTMTSISQDEKQTDTWYESSSDEDIELKNNPLTQELLNNSIPTNTAEESPILPPIPDDIFRQLFPFMESALFTSVSQNESKISKHTPESDAQDSYPLTIPDFIIPTTTSRNGHCHSVHTLAST